MPGLGAAEDQRVHVMGALVGVDRLEVLGMAHHVVFGHDAVAAMHVARHPRDVERLAAIVALDQRDHFRRAGALVHQPARPAAPLQAQRDLGLHVGELLLEQLRLRQRLAELLAVEPVLPRAGASNPPPRPSRPRRCRSAPG
jgi:hypothetical protein